jgi:hypothetical protein
MDQAARPSGSHSGVRIAVVDLALILGLYVLAILIAGPWGDFPINDDWSWAYATRTLLYDHVWRPTGFTSMPLISHSLWDGMFCLAAGNCSFETLRLANVAAGTLAVGFTYGSGREIGLARGQALLPAALLAANPLFFSQSLTSMTDITFVGFAAPAMYFFLRALRRRATRDLVLAALISVVATLCRQLGPFLAAGFAVAVLIRDGFTVRNLAGAVWPGALCAVALVAFNSWMSHQGVTPSMYSLQNDGIAAALHHPPTLVRNIADVAATFLAYLGLFCAPILIARRAPDVGTSWPARALAALGVLFAIGVQMRRVHNSGRFPFAGNILNAFGVGPHPLVPLFSLPDSAFSRILMGPGWWVVTALAILGGAVLMHRLIAVALRTLAARDDALRMAPATEAFFLVSAVTFAAPLLLFGNMYDRYILPEMLVVPFVGLTLGPKPAASTLRKGLALAVLAAFAFFSVCWGHDFMSWNRARWTLTHRALASGIPESDLNGGFEFTYPPCWHPRPTCDIPTQMRSKAPYIIAFAPLRDFRQIDAEPYGLWLPISKRSILLLQREKPVELLDPQTKTILHLK